MNTVDFSNDANPSNLFINSRYTYISLLGTGGMAVVLKCKDNYMERDVAVKIIKHGVPVERFEQEVRVLARINNGNVVTIYDFGIVENGYYRNCKFYTMPILNGKTLDVMIRENYEVVKKQRYKISLEIVKTMDFLSQQNIIHRDLKPSNIFIIPNEDFKVVISDFGIARRLDDIGRITKDREYWGSILYSAPEQDAFFANCSFKADIFSIGCVFHELVSGKTLLKSQNFNDILEEKKNPIISNIVPRKWKKIIKRCICKEEKRFSIQELYQQLKQMRSRSRILAQSSAFVFLSLFTLSPNFHFYFKNLPDDSVTRPSVEEILAGDFVRKEIVLYPDEVLVTEDKVLHKIGLKVHQERPNYFLWKLADGIKKKKGIFWVPKGKNIFPCSVKIGEKMINFVFIRQES